MRQSFTPTHTSPPFLSSTHAVLSSTHPPRASNPLKTSYSFISSSSRAHHPSSSSSRARTHRSFDGILRTRKVPSTVSRHRHRPTRRAHVARPRRPRVDKGGVRPRRGRRPRGAGVPRRRFIEFYASCVRCGSLLAVSRHKYGIGCSNAWARVRSFSYKVGHSDRVRVWFRAMIEHRDISPVGCRPQATMGAGDAARRRRARASPRAADRARRREGGGSISSTRGVERRGNRATGDGERTRSGVFGVRAILAPRHSYQFNS